MHHWKWHDFNYHRECNGADEPDPFIPVPEQIRDEYITRDFWVGSSAEGHRSGFQARSAYTSRQKGSVHGSILRSSLQRDQSRLILLVRCAAGADKAL